MRGLSFKRSLAWMGGASLLGQIVTWSITIIVARLLTPADYGLVALSGLFTVFAVSVSEMGVGAAVIQQSQLSQQQIRSLYTLSIAVGVGMTLFGIGIAPLLASIFDEPKIIPLTRFQSLIFIISALKSMQRTVLVCEKRFDILAKVEMVSRILTSLCTLSLAYYGAGVWALAAQWLWIEFFQFVGFGVIRRIRPTLNIQFSQIRDVLSFGLGVMARNMFFKLYSMADVAIIGRFASKDFLGAYTFSKQLTNMPFEKILTLVNQVLFPYLSTIKEDNGKIRDWTMLLADLEAYVLIPFFILLFFCATEVVSLVLGPTWANAVLPVRVFCIANIFKLADNYNSTVLTALGEIKVQVKFSLIQLFVISSGMIALCKLWNPEAAIYVWVSLYPVVVLFLTAFMLRRIELGWNLFWPRVKTMVACHSFLILILLMLNLVSWQGFVAALVVKVGVGGLSFLGMLYLLDKERASEIYSILVNRKGGKGQLP